MKDMEIHFIIFNTIQALHSLMSSSHNNVIEESNHVTLE